MFLQLAETRLQNGGELSFEWPDKNYVWTSLSIVNFVHRHQLYTTIAEGKRFACSSHRLAVGISKHEQQTIRQQEFYKAETAHQQGRGCASAHPILTDGADHVGVEVVRARTLSLRTLSNT